MRPHIPEDADDYSSAPDRVVNARSIPIKVAGVFRLWHAAHLTLTWKG